MKSFMKKSLCSFLALCIISSFICASTSAVERSSSYLDNYAASLTTKSGGKIVITVDVNALRTMTKLGASKIYLYESKDGSNFNCIKTYNYTDYPIMMSSGVNFAKDVVTYYGTAGNEYFAIVYVYAGNSTGYDEQSYTTSSVKAF